MADEQPPPKRDVNELFTLDASGPSSDPDGPLAHLLSMSPVSDLARQSDKTTGEEPRLDDPEGDRGSAAGGGSGIGRPGADGDLPGIADVGGLEDLYVTTAELPLGDAPADPLPPTTISSWAAGVVEQRPFGPRPDRPDRSHPADPGGVRPRSTERRPAHRRPKGPAPVRRDSDVDADPFRSFEVGGNLRFSTEAGQSSVGGWSPSGPARPYPAALVPHAVPAPVSPSRSVRVPGQQRRRGTVPTALIEITERRWFWASVASVLGLVVLALLAVGDFVPNPLVTDRTDVVADDRVPAAPAVGGATETSEADTSSSTGAGSGGLQPADSTTSSESTTSSTATTSARRVITTARPTVRSTTAVPTSAPASSSTTTTVSSSSTATTATSSSTTGSSSSTTSTTTTVTTSVTTAPSTTTTTEGDTTTTTASGSSSTTGGP